MSVNQVFIEFGSLATKVIEVNDNKIKKNVYSKLNPLNISENGKLNFYVFNAKVLERLKNFINKNYSEETKIRAFATGIYRHADNSNYIIELLRSIGNLELRILSVEEECILSFNSYLQDYPDFVLKDVVYIDIGGGSTEIALFKNNILDKCISLEIGVLSLVQNFLDGDENISNGILRVQETANFHCEKNIEFFDYLRMLLGNNSCSLVITGMVAKKVHIQYRQENNVSIKAFQKYLDIINIPMQDFKNIGHLKNNFIKNKKNCVNKTNRYVGSLFLNDILARFNAESFYINDKGLDYA